MNGLLKIIERLFCLHIDLILVLRVYLLLNPNHLLFDASLLICQSQMIS